jgi:ferredoxin
MRTQRLTNPGSLIAFDERDTVFARIRLVRGTPEHEAYYEANPELLEADEKMRALRGIAAPGTRCYRPGEAAIVEATFEASDLVAQAVDRIASSARVPEGLGPSAAPEDGPRHAFDATDAGALTRFVREASLFLGADDVGIARLDPAFVYTHRGRRSFGEEVELDHTHAIVLVMAMRHPYVLSSPEMTSTCETGLVYQRSAAACFSLASALGRFGLEARAHVDSNYLVICPPLAVDAGLGELGRNGVLIHHTFGPGVRLGVVTVKAELEADGPGCWGIADFCARCGKCADNCPSGAIVRGEPTEVRGALKWPIDPVRCYRYWRTLGTDCGLCLRTCPFAKPDTPLHRFVRWLIRDSTSLHTTMLRADDLVYGRKPRTIPPPLLEIGSSKKGGE